MTPELETAIRAQSSVECLQRIWEATAQIAMKATSEWAFLKTLLAERDEEIAALKEQIAASGKAGVPCAVKPGYNRIE